MQVKKIDTYDMIDELVEDSFDELDFDYDEDDDGETLENEMGQKEKKNEESRVRLIES